MIRPTILIVVILLLWNCKKLQKDPPTIWEDPITGMRFVHVLKGRFIMGDLDATDKEVCEVKIEENFWMGETEVTQEIWDQIMGTEELHPEKPSPFKGIHPKFPVVSISYEDVQNFLDKLNQLANNNHFRLPTEAEWEYACRAGTTTAFSFGPQLHDTLANYNAKIDSKFSKGTKYRKQPSPVGTFSPNAWGLYDMHGNVWEWVNQNYSPELSYCRQQNDDSTNAALKVLKGGSWYFSADNARAASRRKHHIADWGFSIGFRVVREERE